MIQLRNEKQESLEKEKLCYIWQKKKLKKYTNGKR